MEILRLTDTDHLGPVSKFLLGPAREALSTYYTDQHLQDFHDPKCYIPTIKTVLNQTELPMTAYYFSQEQGAINGALIGQVMENPGSSDIVGLIDIVAVTQTKRGIGGVLVNAFEQNFKDQVAFFAAWIREDNMPSQKLFTSLGYHQDGVHPNDSSVLGYYRDL